MANKKLIVNSSMTLEQKNLGLLVCTGQELKVRLERQVAPHTLSMLQLSILHSLAFSPDGQLTVNELKAMMVDESPNVSRTLNKMEEAGFIIKLRSLDDQRVVHVSITKAGRKAHEAADEDLMDVTLGLSDKDQELLYKILLKI